jgi:ribonuclease HI
MMTCPKALALRSELRKIWDLPEEEELRWSGQDWVLNILDNQPEETRNKLMFLWWRAWHLRNNSIFGDGKASINHSVSFLDGYYNTTSLIKTGLPELDRKGKGKIEEHAELYPPKMVSLQERWHKPDQGWLKVNTDASYLMNESLGFWGAIVRDHTGNIVASAWSPIDRCCSVGEAEAIAAVEGIRLAVSLNSPTILETDCQYVANALTSDHQDRSQARFAFIEARQIGQDLPYLKIKKISRTANRAAHLLAAYSRSNKCNGELFNSAPVCILEQASLDCNSDSYI